MELNGLNSLKCLEGPILITGHTGFKGTWLSLLLESLEIDFVGYSLPAEKGSLFVECKRQGQVPEKFADIRDYLKLEEFIKQTRPKAVIHLAAQPLVLKSYEQTRETFEINVQGTVNVLDAAIKARNIKTVGIVTTDKVYRNDEKQIRFKEGDPLAGNDPYSASKVAAEAAANAWRQVSSLENGPAILSLRAGNVIGGGDISANRILPDIVRSIRTSENVEVRNPQSTRPWQHALDPLFGYLLALEFSLTDNDAISAFNFGPDSESLEVGYITELAKIFWKEEFGYTQNANRVPKQESKYLDLDSSLAKDVLNWTPAWNQEESVIKTFEWWKKVLNEEMTPEKACRSDVAEFLNIKNCDKTIN